MIDFATSNQDVFDYVIKNGLEANSDYPTLPEKGDCKFDKSKVAATVSDYVIVNNNEEQLRQKLYEQGAFAVELFMQEDLMYHYR